MRVTTFGINAQYLSDLNNIMSKYQGLEQQLSTGRKLNHPSDDPVAFESDIQSQTSIGQVNQWASNASSASTQMQSTDAAMNTLQNTLGALRSQLVGAVNGTNTPADYGNTLGIVEQQVQSVAQGANFNDGQQYIFSGANGKVLPITVSSGTLTWNAGVTPDQNATIGSNVRVKRNVNGQQLFAQPPSNAPGSPSLIDTLNNIVADMTAASQSTNSAALQSNAQKLGTDLADLDANMDNVSTMRADLGGRMDRVQAVQTQLAQSKNLLTKQQSNAEDADVAQVLTQLTTQQTVYQAALMSGQKLILPTLADVLKG